MMILRVEKEQKGGLSGQNKILVYWLKFCVFFGNALIEVCLILTSLSSSKNTHGFLSYFRSSQLVNTSHTRPFLFFLLLEQMNWFSTLPRELEYALSFMGYALLA